MMLVKYACAAVAVLAIAFIALCLYTLWPMKLAVEYKNIDKTRPHILVSIEEITGFEYVMKGGTFEQAVPHEGVHLVNFYGSDDFAEDIYKSVGKKNVFVCYGYFEDGLSAPFGVDGKTFFVEAWDILYPIVRNSDADGKATWYERWFITKLDWADTRNLQGGGPK